MSTTLGLTASPTASETMHMRRGTEQHMSVRPRPMSCVKTPKPRRSCPVSMLRTSFLVVLGDVSLDSGPHLNILLGSPNSSVGPNPLPASNLSCLSGKYSRALFPGCWSGVGSGRDKTRALKLWEDSRTPIKWGQKTGQVHNGPGASSFSSHSPFS